MRAAGCAFFSVALLACGSSNEAPPTSPPPPTSTAPRWELHEWGLLGFAIDDAEGALVAVGTGPSPAAASVGHGSGTGSGQAYAPVVYVQLLDETPEVTFDLRVDLTRDAIVEAWPSATRDDHGAIWTGVHATRATAPCGAAYPVAGDAFCAGAGESCEAAVGASYESSDGACLTLGDTHADFLLYRATVARSALPFDVTREGDTLRVVAHAGAPAGRILRLQRSFETSDVRVASFDAPAGGESIVVPELSAAEAEATVADLVHGMSDEGLTDAEVAAFRAGWRDAIVPEATPTLFPEATRMALPCGARPTSDAIYYWVRGETADHLLPLVATPVPTAMRRALLVRIGLDAPVPAPVAIETGATATP